MPVRGMPDAVIREFEHIDERARRRRVILNNQNRCADGPQSHR
jgi:hypothetical protein